MLRWRLGLVVLSVLVLGPGCYASHHPSIEAGSDAPSDAPPDLPPDAPPSDTGLDVGADAPRSDVCEVDVADRLETLCTVTTTGDLPAGEPFQLAVRWSACRCEEGRSCLTRIEDGLIDIRSSSCLTELDCDDCAFEGVCAVPALVPGDYRIRLDGRDVFDVRAVSQPPGRDRRPRCYEVPAAPDAALSCGFDWDARVVPAQVCYHRVEDVGTYVGITVTSTCRGCFDWSAGCSVERDGERLIVRPRVQTCECPTCGACEEPCQPTTVMCRSVALRDGLYRVLIEDAAGEPRDVGPLEVADVAGPGPEVCFTLE